MDAPDSSPPPSVVPAPASEFRPRSVAVLGVLNIVFGCLGLLCHPVFFGLLVFAARQADAEPATRKMVEDPVYLAFMIVTGLLAIALSTASIVGGIGLLRLRGWGRRLSLMIAVAGLVLPPVELAFDYAVLTHDAIVAGRAKGGEALAEPLAEEVVYVGYELLSMIYPAVLLYFLTRPNVARSFAAERPSDESRGGSRGPGGAP